MPVIRQVARQARITAYRDSLLQKLASRVIDIGKPRFKELEVIEGIEVRNGEILLEIEHFPDGSLKGFHAVDIDDLAQRLPDIKVDTEDRMGWKKWLDMLNAEGINILEGVDDPRPNEYELTTVEELTSLDVSVMSDYEAKQKLLELQQKLALEG